MRRRPEPLRYWRSTVLEDSSFHWNNWLAIRATVSGKHKEDKRCESSPPTFITSESQDSFCVTSKSLDWLEPSASLESSCWEDASSVLFIAEWVSPSLAFESLGAASFPIESFWSASYCASSSAWSDACSALFSSWFLSVLLFPFSPCEGCDVVVSSRFIRWGST